jgi:uncharacterized membrane protein
MGIHKRRRRTDEEDLMADDPVFVYIATYHSYPDAEQDWGEVKYIHDLGAHGTYDAAIVAREDDGKVSVSKVEKGTRRGAWTGVAVGAMVGVLFPPAIIGTAVAGGAAGALAGHLSKGISREDLREVGDLLDQGDAFVILVGDSSMKEPFKEATKHAKDVMEKQVEGGRKHVEAELEQALQAQD